MNLDQLRQAPVKRRRAKKYRAQDLLDTVSSRIVGRHCRDLAEIDVEMLHPRQIDNLDRLQLDGAIRSYFSVIAENLRESEVTGAAHLDHLFV